MSKSSLSANLRANGQKQHSKAEPQGESAQHDEAHLDYCGRVNAVVVQRKIMCLPGEICLPNPSFDFTDNNSLYINQIDRFQRPLWHYNRIEMPG